MNLLGKRLASRTPSQLEKSSNSARHSARRTIEEDPLAGVPVPARLPTLGEADVPLASRPRKPRSRMGKIAKVFGFGRTPFTQIVEVNHGRPPPKDAEAPEPEGLTVSVADAILSAGLSVPPLSPTIV